MVLRQRCLRHADSDITAVVTKISLKISDVSDSTDAVSAMSETMQSCQIYQGTSSVWDTADAAN